MLLLGRSASSFAVHHHRPPKPTLENLKTTIDTGAFDLTTKLDDVHIDDPTRQADAEDDYDVLPDLAGLEMYPDPELLVGAIERSARMDLASRFFVRCLQAYQALSGDSDADPE